MYAFDSTNNLTEGLPCSTASEITKGALSTLARKQPGQGAGMKKASSCTWIRSHSDSALGADYQ